MTALAWGLTAILLFLLAVIASAWYAENRYRAERPFDQVHFTKTKDGFRLALTRYLPVSERGKLPVLMVHGLGANGASMDLGEGRSLARHLCAQGRDVWLLELRGCGLSEAGREWGQGTWTFDTFVDLDVPAALDTVHRATGAPQLHWVGHSMGGMIAYAYLQQCSDKRVRSLVTVSSPGGVEHAARFRPILRLLKSRRRPLRQVGAARAIAPFVGRFPMPMARMFVNVDNVEPHVLRTALASLPANIAGGVAAQFAGWIDAGVVEGGGSVEGGRGYSFDEHGFGRIDLPVLLLAGTADRLAPVESVRKVYEYLGSTDKVLAVPGGEGRMYGHGDILIGDHVEEDVFPVISNWLDSHEPKEQA